MAMMFTQLRSKFYFWHFFMALIVLRYLCMSISNFSQYRYLSQEAVPTDIKAYLDQATWNGLRSVGLDYFKFLFWEDFISQAYFLILIGYGLLPKAWDAFNTYSKDALEGFIDPTDDFKRSLVFNLLVSTIHLVTIGPLISIWKFQKNDLDVMPFYFIAILAGVFLQWMLLLIVRVTRKRKIVATGLICGLIILAFVLLGAYGPDSLVEAHGKFPNNAQNSGVYNLLRKVGFPLHRVVQDKILNAMTGGFGQKAFILIGTKLHDVGIRGRILESVVAHELGHWKYMHYFFHPTKLVLISMAVVISFFYIVDRPSFYRSFGFLEYNKVPMGIGTMLFSILLTHSYFLLTPLTNLLNWQIEYQADGHAAHLGYAKELTNFLVIFAKQYQIVEMPIMTTMYGLVYSTHPVFADRVAALAKHIK